MKKETEHKNRCTNHIKGRLQLSSRDYKKIAKIISLEIINREYIQHYSEIEISDTLHIVSFIVINKTTPEIVYLSLMAVYSKNDNNMDINILKRLIN